MSTSIPPPLPSPGVGARRKGPKALPRLPPSAFSPPNTGTSDKFPVAPSPSSLQPIRVVDAHVAAPNGDYSAWVRDAPEALGGKASGVVLSLQGTNPADIGSIIDTIRSTPGDTPVLALLVPFSLDAGAPTEVPAYLDPQASNPRIVLSVVYMRYSREAVEAVRWATEKGFTLDLNIETNLRAGEGAWEDLEQLLTEAFPETPKGNIVLSNILPPPDDLSLPIVKLLSHPTYQIYQTQTAALSLYGNVSVKFVPPSWSVETIDKKEWKRRMKMYIGPALEAFGFERILWGSSPTVAASTLDLAEWYDLSREAWAELGIEAECIDALFHENATRIYTS